jgi:ligand-binding SRPBCC domain-containing protein
VTHFELVNSVRASPPVVFGCALDVDVHAASMASSAERAVAGVMSGQMKLGDQVTWRGRHLGLWWRLTSRITAYDPPWSFVDEQIAGPFASWHHEHQFEASGSGTLMRDVVDFAAPYGSVGRIAEAAVLNRYMVRLIQQRNRHVIAVAEGIQKGEDHRGR